MIQDLCVIMLTAGITSLLFKLFKQPVVLGYIVAGLLIGPHVLGDFWITNEESVNTWGNIGVLFLLFSLGLEFSIKKLIQVGNTAIIGAGTIVIGMMTSGFIAGRLMGWNQISSLFLGGMLCMSSTTIVFKAIDDAGLRSHKFAKVCFGILVVEDLFAVILMVLLSSIAVKNQFEGDEMLFQIGKLVIYLFLWFIIGIYILPSFLKHFRKHLNDETLTILSIGLCLGMVLLAVESGFSSALGAFVMGSILAETIEAERIEHLIAPIKNIFGSIFFVSVGIMLDPELLVKYWAPIAIISAIVIVGQITFGSIGTLLSGQSLRVSLQTGFSLVQIGEFAFIIAGLGQELGVTDSSLYPIVVAVSVLTTFLTPYIMNLAYPTLDFINKHLSNRAKEQLEARQQGHKNTKGNPRLQNAASSVMKFIIRSAFVRYIITHFTENLYARENLAEARRAVKSMDKEALLAFDIHISEFDIPENSCFCGKRLRDLNIRQLAGVSVVSIMRGEMNIIVPGGERHVYPHDKLIVAGTDQEMDRFTRLLNGSLIKTETSEHKASISLEHIHIGEKSELIGKSIKNSKIREQAACIVMGIVRPDDNIYMNPDPAMEFNNGDFIIVAGEQDKIKQFKEQQAV
ncbi:MAG: cation:proton antiporter [Bacteroidaceae bacterium]|nr:cation:proton antiporter [Bacteroidaceae bacterium]